LNYNSDFKYDLLVGQIKEQELGEVLAGKKIEVKRDLMTPRTGNVYVEFRSRGKLSGISTTEADWYCFAINSSFILIETSILKKICRRHYKKGRIFKGGDNNTSEGFLIPIMELF